MKSPPSRPRPALWPWMLVVVVVVLAALYSPLTGARKIEASGVPPFDRPRIEEITQKLHGQAWKLINKQDLVAAIESEPYVDHATYEANIFGRGTLKIVYRLPVARLINDATVYIDEKGQLFRLKDYKTTLPTLMIPVDVIRPSASVTTGYDLVGVGEVAKLTTDRLPNYAWRVELDSRSVLFLQMEKGVRVILGSADRLDSKIERLSEILTQKPELRNAKEINLSVPNQPVYQP